LLLEGYNETLITYVLAALPHLLHPILQKIPSSWARNNGGIKASGGLLWFFTIIQLKHNGAEEMEDRYLGGLFYLRSQPKGFKDSYADYWERK